MDVGSEVPPVAPRAARRPSPFDEVLQVLRLAFTLRMDPCRVVGRDATFLLLGLAALGVWAALDWLKADGPVRPDSTGLQGLAICVCASAAVAWLVARSATPPLPLRRTAWLFAGYLPAAAAALGLLTATLPRPILLAIGGAFGVHAALYFYFGLRALAGAPDYRAFAATVAAVALLLPTMHWLAPPTGVWKPHLAREHRAHIRESLERSESLLYAQPERIEAALAAVPASSGPGPNVYFVGFAGYGDQRVFGQEIRLAEQRVRERYGAGDSSVLLINDRRDFDQHPLASPSALERAIRGIAAKMDRERDVLFLALSSHGRKDPHLVVSNAALPLDDLTPERLADILERSGIRWRVLVISACYAGAFMERLSDPDSIVIAAAAPDRMSFGCNDERELTNFGEAFYRDSLPAAEDLRAAFETTASVIAARERREGLKPSQPQAHFGAAIERKLAELERRRVPGEESGESARQASNRR
jgi:Peptidase C13 family